MPETAENVRENRPSSDFQLQRREGDLSRPDEDWMQGIFETFSLDSGSKRTLFDSFEKSACMLADRVLSCQTNETRSIHRGLVSQFFKAAKGYAYAFETLAEDPVISWFAEKGTYGPQKVKLLRKKKENLCETIHTLEKVLVRRRVHSRQNRAVNERVIRGANLRRSREKQLEKEVQEILEAASSVVNATTEGKSRQALQEK